MRAVYYERNGTARDVLRVAEVETPQPGPGEVRVRLAASGVNPSDVKSRAGVTRKIAFPRVIPHSDGAGEIECVGEGVSPSRVGERVWVWNGQWRRPFGTAAESIVLPSGQAVPLPANTSMEVGACLGIPAYTAYQAVELDGVKAGVRVLVAGGAGAVGHYAIQFAKKRKASVITTVSSPVKAEIARRAGADHVIDYRREDVGERVMEFTGKAGVDVVIEVDLAANARLLPSVIAPTGWSQSTAAARPRRPSRSSSCCRTASTSNFFWFTRCRYSCARRRPPRSRACSNAANSCATWRRPSLSPTSRRRTRLSSREKAMGNVVVNLA